MKEEGVVKKKYNPLDAPVVIEIREVISAKLTKDGQLEGFKVIGEGFLQVMDSAIACSEIHCQVENSKNFNIRAHPNLLDSKEWKKNKVLKPKGKQKVFPSLKECRTIKYKYSSTNADDVPFLFEFWPSEN